METGKMNRERIITNENKHILHKNDLMNLLLFFILYVINIVGIVLTHPLNPGESRNILDLFIRSLVNVSLNALVGFVLSNIIFKKKDKNEKIKYGLIFSIVFSLIMILPDVKKENIVKIFN